MTDLFIGAYLIFAIFWDAPKSSLIHHALRNRIEFLVRFAGLDYAWSMYTGPFIKVNRLLTRVTYNDGNTVLLPPPELYEFRRFYFMIGNRDLKLLFWKYLRVIEKDLRASGKQPVRIELLKQVSNAPVRRGGFWGRFEVADEKACSNTVLANWNIP